MKLSALFVGFFFIVKCLSFPPEKAHSAVIPFADLKQALTADVSNSPYYVDVLQFLDRIDAVDTLEFELEIPETWKNREIFIGFEGSQLNFSFYVNGQFIESIKDTQNLAEWRLNKIAKIGVNKFKFKAHFRNNIYRAYIYTTPKLLISNFTVNSQLDLSKVNGTIEILGEVRNLDKRDYYKYSIEFALYDAKNKLVFSEKSPAFSFGKSKNKTKGINYSRALMNINPWSMSDPYLYTLVINMRDGDDNSELEILSSKIAFRDVKILDNHLIVNGIRRPFNANEINFRSDQFGHDSLRQMIYSLKKLNTNCLYSNKYIPTALEDIGLKTGILIFLDSNSVFSTARDSSFKTVEINWVDTSKTSVKFENFNLEVDKEDIACYWYLKEENKVLVKGNFKLKVPIQDQNVWILPENLLKQREKEGLKLSFVIKYLNENFWHQKNWIVRQQSFDY